MGAEQVCRAGQGRAGHGMAWHACVDDSSLSGGGHVQGIKRAGRETDTDGETDDEAPAGGRRADRLLPAGMATQHPMASGMQQGRAGGPGGHLCTKPQPRRVAHCGRYCRGQERTHHA
jgi:hypothetical protein